MHMVGQAPHNRPQNQPKRLIMPIIETATTTHKPAHHQLMAPITYLYGYMRALLSEL